MDANRRACASRLRPERVLRPSMNLASRCGGAACPGSNWTPRARRAPRDWQEKARSDAARATGVVSVVAYSVEKVVTWRWLQCNRAPMFGLAVQRETHFAVCSAGLADIPARRLPAGRRFLGSCEGEARLVAPARFAAIETGAQRSSRLATSRDCDAKLEHIECDKTRIHAST